MPFGKKKPIVNIKARRDISEVKKQIAVLEAEVEKLKKNKSFTDSKIKNYIALLETKIKQLNKKI